jgi:hypothetical protein
MARTTVSSVSVPVQLSFDDGLTWKDLVCLTNYSNPLANSLNAQESFCGVFQGQGVPSMDFSGEAICDLTPNPTEVSMQDLDSAMLAQQILLARVVYPGTGSVGTLLYRKSEVVVENVTLKGSTNALLMFDFSLKGQGTPTVTT